MKESKVNKTIGKEKKGKTRTEKMKRFPNERHKYTHGNLTDVF